MMDHNGSKNIRSLTILGSGSGYAARGRGGPACLVHINQHVLLLDCGESVSGWINEFGLAEKLPIIVISHLHPDHVSGLFVLLQNMKLSGRRKDLDIYLPQEGIEPLQCMQQGMYLDFTSSDAPFLIHYIPIRAGELIRHPEYTLTAWASDHFSKDALAGKTQRPAFGFTIDAGGKRLVYTGDVASVSPFSSELNKDTVLICESTHISSREIVEIVRKKGTRNVIFVHIDPNQEKDLKEFCASFDFVHLADDGLKINW